MIDQIELLKENIRRDKEQMRLLKVKIAQSSDALEVKESAQAIERLIADIRSCKDRIAQAISIEQDFSGMCQKDIS